MVYIMHFTTIDKSVHLLFQCVILWEWQAVDQVVPLPTEPVMKQYSSPGQWKCVGGLWLLFIMRKDGKKKSSSPP